MKEGRFSGRIARVFPAAFRSLHADVVSEALFHASVSGGRTGGPTLKVSEMS